MSLRLLALCALPLLAGCAGATAGAPAAADATPCNPCYIEVRNLVAETRDIRVGEAQSGMVVGTLGPNESRRFSAPSRPQQVWATVTRGGSTVAARCRHRATRDGVDFYECSAR